jgi:hypothetical protein
MKRSFWAIIILVQLSAAGMAQAGFRPGFIIKSNNDTLNGLVYYGKDGKFEKECRFKRFDIAEAVTYSPDQLKAYGFRNGRYFESKSPANRNIFLECIEKGPVSVYINPGKPNGQVYLEQGSTGILKLAKGTNNIQGTGNFSSFRETVIALLNKSGIQAVSADKLAYRAADIGMFIRKSGAAGAGKTRSFYATSPVHYIQDFSLVKPASIWSIGFTGGYQYLLINVDGSNYVKYFNVEKFNPSYRPAAGIYITHPFSRKSNLASFDVAAYYFRDTYYCFTTYKDAQITYRDDIFMDFSAIQVPLSLKLTFGKGHMHPYIKAGAFMTFLVSQSYIRYSERQLLNVIYTNHFSDYKFKNETGFLGGIGFDFRMGAARTISLEAGYMNGKQRMEGYNSDVTTWMHTSTISIMARISL